MLSAGFFVLIVEILLFVAISAMCGWELIRTTPQVISCLRRLRERHRASRGSRQQEHESTQQDSPEEGESMSGVGARRSVQTMVFLACILKAGLILYTLVRSSWAPYLVAPDLAYLATYGSLVIFLAEMQQIRVGTRHVWIKFAAWALLAIVLIASFIVCAVYWWSGQRTQRLLAMRRFLYYELGVTYLVIFVAFVYFGVRICAKLTHNKRILYRLVLLTSVCGFAMFSKGCALVVAASVNDWRSETLFSSSAVRYIFEAFIALDELIPSIAIMLLTSKARGNRSSAELSERFDESSDLYITSFVSAPTLSNTLYGSGINAV